MLAIGAVVAVVLLLIGAFGRSAGDPNAAGSPGPGSSTPATAPPPAAPPTAGTPSATGTTATPESSTPPLPTEFPVIPVVVLNSTSEAGLAGRVSAYLEELGWSTGPIGNFAVSTELTTVYHPEGYEDAARALAAAAPGSGSLIALVIPEVSAEALTVVLGEDSVGWVTPDETGSSTASISPTGTVSP